jgi:hypothetical protein
MLLVLVLLLPVLLLLDCCSLRTCFADLESLTNHNLSRSHTCTGRTAGIALPKEARVFCSHKTNAQSDMPYAPLWPAIKATTSILIEFVNRRNCGVPRTSDCMVENMAILPAAAIPAATHSAVSVYIVTRHDNESRFGANVLGGDTILKCIGRFRS